MLMALLLLSGSVSMGSSEDHYYKKYGDKVSMPMKSRVYFITFVPVHSYKRVTVFSRMSSIPAERKRGYFAENKYVIEDLTQRDSGRYLMRDNAQNLLFTKSVEVTAHSWNVTLSPSEYLNVTFNLDPSSCNIYVYTDDEYTEEVLLVDQGISQEDYIQHCGPYEFLWPCGISSKSCSGRYEIRDNHDNKAVVVHVFVDSVDPMLYIIGIGVAVIALLFVCCCVKRCRRKKSAAPVDSPQTAAAAAAEPAVQYNTYEHEPVVLRPSHESQPPSEMHRAAQPSCALTGPLIHNPPTTGLPPASGEAVASTEQPDAPSLPLYSDPGPQFEVRGMTFPSAPPLSSDSACEVYTSEKLNFL